jgi:hypothetical protein
VKYYGQGTENNIVNNKQVKQSNNNNMNMVQSMDRLHGEFHNNYEGSGNQYPSLQEDLANINNKTAEKQSDNKYLNTGWSEKMLQIKEKFNNLTSQELEEHKKQQKGIKFLNQEKKPNPDHPLIDFSDNYIGQSYEPNKVEEGKNKKLIIKKEKDKINLKTIEEEVEKKKKQIKNYN